MALARERGIRLPADDMDASIACGQRILEAQNKDGTAFDVDATLVALKAHYGSAALETSDAALFKRMGKIEVGNNIVVNTSHTSKYQVVHHHQKK